MHIVTPKSANNASIQKQWYRSGKSSKRSNSKEISKHNNKPTANRPSIHKKQKPRRRTTTKPIGKKRIKVQQESVLVIASQCTAQQSNPTLGVGMRAREKVAS
jgi:hypothetical protein